MRYHFQYNMTMLYCMQSNCADVNEVTNCLTVSWEILEWAQSNYVSLLKTECLLQLVEEGVKET